MIHINDHYIIIPTNMTYPYNDIHPPTSHHRHPAPTLQPPQRSAPTGARGNLFAAAATLQEAFLRGIGADAADELQLVTCQQQLIGWLMLIVTLW